MGEVCNMAHEWAGPTSLVPNMVRTQPYKMTACNFQYKHNQTSLL